VCSKPTDLPIEKSKAITEMVPNEIRDHFSYSQIKASTQRAFIFLCMEFFSKNASMYYYYNYYIYYFYLEAIFFQLEYMQLQLQEILELQIEKSYLAALTYKHSFDNNCCS